MGTPFLNDDARARNEKGRCGRAVHLPHSGLSFFVLLSMFRSFPLSRRVAVSVFRTRESSCVGISLSFLKRLSWISRGAERGEQWVPAEGRLINCAHTRLTFFFFRLPPMITTVCAKEMHHHPQQGCRGTAGDD